MTSGRAGPSDVSSAVLILKSLDLLMPGLPGRGHHFSTEGLSFPNICKEIK